MTTGFRMMIAPNPTDDRRAWAIARVVAVHGYNKRLPARALLAQCGWTTAATFECGHSYPPLQWWRLNPKRSAVLLDRDSFRMETKSFLQSD